MPDKNSIISTKTLIGFNLSGSMKTVFQSPSDKTFIFTIWRCSSFVSTLMVFILYLIQTTKMELTPLRMHKAVATSNKHFFQGRQGISCTYFVPNLDSSLTVLFLYPVTFNEPKKTC